MAKRRPKPSTRKPATAPRPVVPAEPPTSIRVEEPIDPGTLAAIAAALEIEARAHARKRAGEGPSPWALAGRLRAPMTRR